jgi:hypothetical protein
MTTKIAYSWSLPAGIKALLLGSARNFLASRKALIEIHT